MNCPSILPSVIYADDAKLAAQLSCVLARRGSYLAVCDGPRIQRPDADAEVVRRHNAAARAKAKTAYMAGLSKEAADILAASLGRNNAVQCHRIDCADDIVAIFPSPQMEPFVWGRDRIGVGLLKALREKRGIVFEDKASPSESAPSLSGHLVVCEDGEEIAQVIAANYAHALGAGLHLISAVKALEAESAEAASLALGNEPWSRTQS